jgi:hypothetical protein
MKGSNTLYRRVHIAATGAPILIFLYGLLRLIDVMDGNPNHGLVWSLGHVLFFIAFFLFGSLTVELRRLVPVKTKPAQVVAYLSMAASLFGAACFLWGILGDLFTRLHNIAPLPGSLEVVGPLLFQVGVLGLLVMLAATRPRRLPVWSPILVLIGFQLFAINLNLLPIGAPIILFGLSPLVRRSPVI